MALIDTLGEIPDPRRGNAQRHELLDILTIALVASVCGAESCVDFAEFAEDREVLLREFLSLRNGLPSHDTFSRVFRLLDPAAFARSFEAFLDDLGVAGDGVLAIDGKTLRRSFDRAAGRSPLHVVTAFGTGARVAIAQRAVADGENETLAASVGIDATHYLVLAALISAGMAGFAGGLYAHYTRFVSPEVFLFTYTVTMVIMVVAGGKGTLAGPVVGAVLFTVLPEALRAATSWQWQMLLYGVLLLVVLFCMPAGIVPALRSVWPALREQAARRWRTS